jgi:hypothetical protein
MTFPIHSHGYAAEQVYPRWMIMRGQNITNERGSSMCAETAKDTARLRMSDCGSEGIEIPEVGWEALRPPTFG